MENKKNLKQIVKEEYKYIKNLIEERRKIQEELQSSFGVDDAPFGDDFEAASRGVEAGIPSEEKYSKEDLQSWFNEDPEGFMSFIQEPTGEVDETTGLGLGVQHRASHKGEAGGHLELEDELDEMMTLSKGNSLGKTQTTNPLHLSRVRRGYSIDSVNEGAKLRAFIKNQLLETYGLKKTK